MLAMVKSSDSLSSVFVGEVVRGVVVAVLLLLGETALPLPDPSIVAVVFSYSLLSPLSFAYHNHKLITIQT